jgi:hypothetical protein
LEKCISKPFERSFQKLATQPTIKKHEIDVPESLSNEAQEFDSELDRWFGGIVTLQHPYTRKL